MSKKFRVCFELTASQMTELLIDFGQYVTEVKALDASPTGRRSSAPNLSKHFRCVATGSGQLAGLQKIIWDVAKAMPSPVHRDDLTSKAQPVLVKAGYARTSASAGVSQLIKKGNLKEVNPK